MAELREVMTPISTYNGPAFYYKAQLDIAILTMAAISVPHH